ncbi:hypothetical protein U1Q18_013900 [Sarracenia purpurea var. burkii]
MGWVWKDDAEDAQSIDISGLENANPRSGDRCSTRKIIKSQCKTEEVEPGKFVRKCEKTEQIIRDCVGRPSEVVQSNKEYTEEDVSNLMKKGSFPMESSELVPFDFPGLHSDIEAIERSLFGGLGRFFEAAEEMKNGFFRAFGSQPMESDSLPKNAPPKLSNPESGRVDLSGLARDV